MQDLDYKIVSGDTPEALRDQVLSEQRYGWAPWGGPIVDPSGVFHQALTATGASKREAAQARG